MTLEVFFARIEVLASVAFFIWFLYGFWQQTVVSVTRHELFKIRHRLFIMAADGKISFDSPEYGEMRKSINSMIRFCHMITLPRVVAVAFAMWTAPEQQKRRQPLTVVLSKVKDEALRKTLEGQWRKASDFVLLGIFLRSPVLLLLVVPVVVLSPLLSLLFILDRQDIKSRYKVVRSTVERGIELETCQRDGSDLVFA